MMSDDLRKRLWKHDMRPESVSRQAADRIEELEQVLRDMRDDKTGFRHVAHFRRRAAVALKLKTVTP